MDETKKVKTLRFWDVAYLKNALGEDIGNANIPEEVSRWYNREWHGEENCWLPYLVKMNGEHGILYVLEFPHPSSDDDRVTRAHGVKSFEEVIILAEKVNEQTRFVVYVGKRTGVRERHEIALFVPYGEVDHTIPDFTEFFEQKMVEQEA